MLLNYQGYLTQAIQIVLIFLAYLLSFTGLQADIIQSYELNNEQSCSGKNSLVVFSGHEIPALLKYQREVLSAYQLVNQKWHKVPFQIDPKDALKRFIFHPDELSTLLGSNDDLVLRKKDAGERLEPATELTQQGSFIELKLGQDAWIYIKIDSQQSIDDTKDTVHDLSYDKQQDSISSLLYKIGFSKRKPFLLESFQWKHLDGSGFTDDISDTMKIRHKGKFFGLPFKRTQDDYSSQVVAVKEGPLRIIRRTENRIKVFWKLKSPALYIDYVMMPNGFIMDTMIDIPFKIALFFSELETLTTMDWNQHSVLTAQMITTQKANLYLPVNGEESEDKRAFNQIQDTHFSVASSMGNFAVKLDIPKDFNIQPYLYLKDNLQEADQPENYKGQFANVGFRTTGWENIDSCLYHLKFSVCIDRN